MSWGKVDDKLHTHPKVDDAGIEAMGLWVLAMSYCADQLTDGFVSAERVRKLAGSRGASLSAKLVASGLWHAVPYEDGYQFHDWSKYQPTKAKVLGERESAVKRMNNRRSSSDVRANTDRTSGAVTKNFELGSPSPYPSRPVPTRDLEPRTKPAEVVVSEARDPEPPHPPQSAVRPTSSDLAVAADPDIARVVDAVRAHPKLSHLAYPDVVAAVSYAMPVSNRKKLAWYLTSVAQCGVDTESGELSNVTLKRLRKYLENSRAPKHVEPEREAAPKPIEWRAPANAARKIDLGKIGIGGIK